MKKLCIISPDTISLPLLPSAPLLIQEGEKSFNLRDKCTKEAATGKRARMFATHLSEVFDVTILIPNLNYPGDSYIDKTQINYSVKPYNFFNSVYNWSDELDKELCKYDVVIIQTTSGAGFLNVSGLPPTTKVIVDGWIPILAEYPAALSYHMRDKEQAWKLFLRQYNALLERADLILYATDRQKYYYEGQLFNLSILNYDRFQKSKMLKVPFGIDIHEMVKRKITDKLNLLWYGPFYPWYDPKLLIDSVKNHKHINVDFFGIRHPRYTQYFDKTFNTEDITSSTNMKIIGEFSTEDPSKLFSNYDACIMISKEWIENTYAHRARFFEILSYGMPLIINEGSSLIEEYPQLSKAVLEIQTKYIGDLLDYAYINRSYYGFSNNIFMDFQSSRNWKNIILPLKYQLLEILK